LLKSLASKKLGFEISGVIVDQFNELKNSLLEIELVPIKEIVENLRAVKDQDEIKLIKKASEITDKTFNYIPRFY